VPEGRTFLKTTTLTLRIELTTASVVTQGRRTHSRLGPGGHATQHPRAAPHPLAPRLDPEGAGARPLVPVGWTHVDVELILDGLGFGHLDEHERRTGTGRASDLSLFVMYSLTR
jgi:hypothetical protein